MIKGLPRVVALTMFVVLAAFALCVTSAAARPHGITGGNKQCIRLPHHKHHNHRKCWKHHKRKRRHSKREQTTKTVEENSLPKVEVQPVPEENLEMCIYEDGGPGTKPVPVEGNCEGFNGTESCQYLPQGCVELPIFTETCEDVLGGGKCPESRCAEKICVLPESPEEECPEKLEEVPGPKG